MTTTPRINQLEKENDVQLSEKIESPFTGIGGVASTGEVTVEDGIRLGPRHALFAQREAAAAKKNAAQAVAEVKALRTEVAALTGLVQKLVSAGAL